MERWLAVDPAPIIVIPIAILAFMGIGLIRLRARARQNSILVNRAKHLELLFGAAMCGYLIYRGVSKIFDGYTLVPIPFFVGAIALIIIMLKR